MIRNHITTSRALMASTAMLATLVTMPAMAQEAPAGETVSEIIVTGSRIRRAESDSVAPLVELGQQNIIDRGYVSAAQALNDLPANVPMLNQADGTGEESGSGIQSPNLFGLGVGRTLTLINGRRMVTSGAGIGAGDGSGDAQVDSNIMPLGLMERVEVYQGGGAAVYGSDAIAGVVNYILKKDFEGLELDAQTGISSRGDYRTTSLRGTAGMNFAGGRGNIAADVSYSKSPRLRFADRPLSALGRLTVPNAADTSATDGIPATKEIFDAAFWPFNPNGVIFSRAAPVPNFLVGGMNNAMQFDSNGNVVPYNVGAYQNIPFASGGDGFAYREMLGLRTGVERFTANVIGHYDLTDRVTVSTELLYARTKGSEIPQGHSYTTLNAGAFSGPIAFNINNPFLTDQAKAALSAANPAFASGSDLYLSKYFLDLVPDTTRTTTTDTYRAALTVEGDFDVGSKNFYWSLSGSYGRVEGKQRMWDVNAARFREALDATTVGGNIVCASGNAACAPINPFGDGNVSQAARDYVSVMSGMDWKNEQVDILATIGGNVISLPTGDIGFSAAYEHRNEKASFSPMEADALGLIGNGTQMVSQSGSYHTNELSAEVIVPIIGKDFTLPLVQALELKGAFRYVDNNRAGTENVWDLGLRWQVTDGVTLRGSRSRNFRAPTLTQMLAPTSVNLSQAGKDPCEVSNINGGPNPAVRYQNCLALFQANPNYGVDADGNNAGLSAAERLAGFNPLSRSNAIATITTTGNDNLRNEVSKTLSYGIVLEPRFIPGLSITADRVEIDLTNGLVLFDTENFAASCFDNPNMDASVCDTFSRIATAGVTTQAGSIMTGTTMPFNAGQIKYRGEVYTVNYRFAVGSLFGGKDMGNLRLRAQASHNTMLAQSVTGESFTRTDDTSVNPRWSGVFNAVYDNGPLRLSYQANYLGKTRSAPDATIETTPVPRLKSNTVHNISTSYEIDNFTIRAGVDNFTDKQPSYPQIAYGDILGRRFFLGVNVKLR